MFSSDLRSRHFIIRALSGAVGFVCGVLLLTEPVNGQTGKRFKSHYFQLAEAATPVALFLSPKNTFLITENGIYQKERKSFEKKYASPAGITCALEEDSILWIGTRKGLLRVNKKTFTVTSVPLPLPENQPRITTLLKDYAGTIWVGAEAYGVFKYTADTFEKVLGAFPVNAGAATRDSAVWIGTNTGLHRWKDKRWVRYNEEGVANFEIPDNIVTSLHPDNQNNLWVIMPEGVAVFETKPHGAESSGHILAVKFIGKPQNNIYSVSYVKQQGYVFATGLGLLFLPEGNSNSLASLEHSPTTDIVENKQMLHSISLPGSPIDFSQPVILQSVNKKNYWLVDRQGIQVLAARQFGQLLQKAKATRTEISKASILPK